VAAPPRAFRSLVTPRTLCNAVPRQYGNKVTQVYVLQTGSTPDAGGAESQRLVNGLTSGWSLNCPAIHGKVARHCDCHRGSPNRASALFPLIWNQWELFLLTCFSVSLKIIT
jgi:hypothetical protein